MRLNNALLRQSASSGEAIPTGEALSLAAAAEAILISGDAPFPRAWTGQGSPRAVDRNRSTLSPNSATPRADVDVQEENIIWLKRHLVHFRELAHGQVSLYEVSLSERLKHAADRGASIQTTRARAHQEPEPDGWQDQRHGHVYVVHAPST